MNRWWDDPRVELAERAEFDAERAARRGYVDLAHRLHLAAAKAYGAVALSVPPNMPNTRRDLMIAAAVCAGHAGLLAAAPAPRRRAVKPGWKTTEFWCVIGANLWAMFGSHLPPAWQATVVSVATGMYGVARAVAKFGALQDPASKPEAIQNMLTGGR